MEKNISENIEKNKEIEVVNELENESKVQDEDLKISEEVKNTEIDDISQSSINPEMDARRRQPGIKRPQNEDPSTYKPEEIRLRGRPPIDRSDQARPIMSTPPWDNRYPLYDRNSNRPPYRPSNRPSGIPYSGSSSRSPGRPSSRPPDRPSGGPPGRPPFDEIQGNMPSGPPPRDIPRRSQSGASLFAVDPGAIWQCRNRFTYLWLTNGANFWAWITFVGRRSIAGYRWIGFRWVYFGTDLNNISDFICY